MYIVHNVQEVNVHMGQKAASQWNDIMSNIHQHVQQENHNAVYLWW